MAADGGGTRHPDRDRLHDVIGELLAVRATEAVPVAEALAVAEPDLTEAEAFVFPAAAVADPGEAEAA